MCVIYRKYDTEAKPTWAAVAGDEPELAAFVAERLHGLSSYLGEAAVNGTGRSVTDQAVRAKVAAAASYDPADRYVLFELCPIEVRCIGYGDVELPTRTRWRVGPQAH